MIIFHFAIAKIHSYYNLTLFLVFRETWFTCWGIIAETLLFVHKLFINNELVICLISITDNYSK